MKLCIYIKHWGIYPVNVSCKYLPLLLSINWDLKSLKRIKNYLGRMLKLVINYTTSSARQERPLILFLCSSFQQSYSLGWVMSEREGVWKRWVGDMERKRQNGGVRRKQLRYIIFKAPFWHFSPKLATSLTVPLNLIKHQLPAHMLLNSPNTFHSLWFYGVRLRPEISFLLPKHHPPISLFSPNLCDFLVYSLRLATSVHLRHLLPLSCYAHLHCDDEKDFWVHV